MQSHPASGSDGRAGIAVPRNLPLFAGVEDRVFARLDVISELRECGPGVRIFTQDDVNPPFVAIVSGQISTFRTAPDGTVTVIDVLRAPAHAGLSAILTQLPQLMGAETVAPSRLLLVDAAGLRALLPEEPSLAGALLRAEAMAFQSLVMQVCDLKLRTTAQRLGHYLLELAPDKTSKSSTMRLPFDKRLLAARLGCRQENLSRAFATLRELGVETRGARVILNDIPRLRDYAVTPEPA